VVPRFIKEKFGTSGYKKWLNALPDRVRNAYKRGIVPYKWYPLKEYYLKPVEKLCDFFYHGDFQGALDVGRADAEYALKGFLRLFIKFGTPNFLVKRASVIFPTYYKNSIMEVIENNQKGCLVRVTEFGKMEKINEYTIKGWMINALGMTGAKDVKVIVKQKTFDDEPCTDFIISWK